jgi:hypothetical protein
MKIRDQILAQLQLQQRSRYQFAMALAMRGVCQHETVLRFLRGDSDGNGRVIEAMLEESGLRVVPADAVPAAAKPARRAGRSSK